MPKTAINSQIELNAVLATPLMLANNKQTTYLRVGLTGFHLKKENIAPINVALVIDKSGSMRGERIHQAKEAAIMTVERLRQSDIISVVTYDHQAKILLPATLVVDKEKITAAINKLVAGGNTALFDGIEKGAKEIRKFWKKERVNRIILVSDGLANVGPNSPQELGKLGTFLSHENIAVTTMGLGLGYHEDLMTELARKSDGNHAFAEQAPALIQIFNHEFRDIFSVVAQEVNVSIICTKGVNPIRVLGREAKIQGQQVSVKLNQLYSKQEKYVLLELEVPPTKAGQERAVAGVAVAYQKMDTNTTDRLSCIIMATFTDSQQQVTKKTNATVMTTVAEQLAVAKNKLAVKLRDEGKIKEAQQTLWDNATRLAEEAAKYNSKTLEKLRTINLADAMNLDEKNWVKQRKRMRQEQYKLEIQQKY